MITSGAQCSRCAERGEAMKRIHDALVRGDKEDVQREMKFLIQSSIEDVHTCLFKIRDKQ